MKAWRELVKIIVKHELPIKPFGYPDIYLAYLIKKNYWEKLDDEEKELIEKILK